MLRANPLDGPVDIDILGAARRGRGSRRNARVPGTQFQTAPVRAQEDALTAVARGADGGLAIAAENMLAKCDGGARASAAFRSRGETHMAASPKARHTISFWQWT